jgi:hypothetical protein
MLKSKLTLLLFILEILLVNFFLVERFTTLYNKIYYYSYFFKKLASLFIFSITSLVLLCFTFN